MGYPRNNNFYSSIGERVADVICNNSGSVKAVLITNTAIEDRFFQLFDLDTLPLTGAKPILSIPIYKNNGYSELTEDIFGEDGVVFDFGITWAFSTNARTYQPAAITDPILNIIWT